MKNTKIVKGRKKTENASDSSNHSCKPPTPQIYGRVMRILPGKRFKTTKLLKEWGTLKSNIYCTKTNVFEVKS